MVSTYRGRLTPDDAETDLLTYDGHAMTFVLINAIKTLAARVEALEQANTTLRAHHPAPTTTEEPLC